MRSVRSALINLSGRWHTVTTIWNSTRPVYSVVACVEHGGAQCEVTGIIGQGGSNPEPTGFARPGFRALEPAKRSNMWVKCPEADGRARFGFRIACALSLGSSYWPRR